MDFRAFEGSNRVMTPVISARVCVCVCKVVMIGKYAYNTSCIPVSVYYDEVDCGSKVMREGGRML